MAADGIGTPRRLAVVAAVVLYAVFWLTSVVHDWGTTGRQFVALGCVLSVVLGFIVGRWEAVGLGILPLVLALSGGSCSKGHDGDLASVTCRASPDLALLMAVVVACVACIALGVAAGRWTRKGRRTARAGGAGD